jgi:hypothetical protein
VTEVFGNVIDEANEHVSIITVCQMLGIELPDDLTFSRGIKVGCPFGALYHSDGGVAPAMRVYQETNSAYCFSCSAYFTPVNLTAQALDVDRRTAALNLLDRIGHRTADPLTVWEQARKYEPDPDKALLADALKTYCRRIDSGWTTRQFEPKVATALTRCLSILDLVHSSEDVTLWLTRCKKAMTQVLLTVEPSLREKYEVLWASMSNEGNG